MSGTVENKWLQVRYFTADMLFLPKLQWQGKWNQSAIWFVNLVSFENTSHKTIESDNDIKVAVKSLNP